MAKQRHTEPQSTSRGTLAVMAVGALLVATLVVWALTRTVEPAPTTSAAPPIASETPSTQAPIGSTTSQVNMTEPTDFSDRSDVKRIAAEDLKAKFDRGEVTIIDVRDANSYASSHIPGSLNIPFASVQGMLDLIPKGKEIVTYCTWPAEESSAGAALIMKQAGINNVSALYGGMDAWKNLGYPVQSGR